MWAKAFLMILLFWKVNLSFIPWRRYLSFILMYFHNLYYALSINFTKKKQRLFTRKVRVIASFNNEQGRFRPYRRGREFRPLRLVWWAHLKKKSEILQMLVYAYGSLMIINIEHKGLECLHGIQKLVIHSL
jgi:hypothetical protein